MKGHYIGSYEDLYMLHCQKVEEMKKDVSGIWTSWSEDLINKCMTHLHIYLLQQLYKADYEDMKTRCFFPQTVTPEYEASKKLDDCKDVRNFGR